MKHMFLLFMALLTSSASAAEPKFDADAAMKKLAPFIDGNTLLVSRTDLQQFDGAAVLALIEPVLPFPAEEKQLLLKVANTYRESLIRVGAKEIFIVAAIDFPFKPCLLVPLGDAAIHGKELFELLKPAFSHEDPSWADLHGFVCIGGKQALERLKARKPSPRADVAEALASTGDAALQVVFAPSADMRKVFEEVSPTLPAEIGGGSIHALTRGLKWISLSVRPTPKAETRLLVQASDAEAALKLQEIIRKSFELAKNLFPDADANERAAYLKLHERVVQLLTPKAQNDQLVVSFEISAAAPEIIKQLQQLRPAARSVSINNLKQIELAMFNYLDSRGGRFPANYLDKAGTPLLSWRVAILPYIEQTELYQKFKLDEPWDSEHNKKLIERMPKIFLSPKQKTEKKGVTTYLAPLGKGLMWDDPKGMQISQVFDGTSNTIMLVESDDEHAVIWTKPDDIVIDMKNPTSGLIGHWNDGFLAGMGDGSVRFVARDYSAIWAMFTRAGGEVLPEK